MVNRPPRILFLDQFGGIGGGQRILLDLVSGARRAGWGGTLLAPDGAIHAAALASGARVIPIALPAMHDGRKTPMDYYRALRFSREAAEHFRTRMEENDLLVVNGLRTMGVARRWVRECNKPAVLYLHGIFRGIPRLLIRWFLRCPKTAAIAVSPVVAQPFGSHPHVHCIPNWVTPAFLFEESHPDALREALAIRDRHPIVLVPGRFSPHKGQLLALEAFRRITDVPLHLVFSGSALFEARGADVERALRAAAEKAPDRVHVLHWDRALPALYDGADLVLIPSVWEEPFGLTAIEAMARRRPLLVTDRGMLPILAERGAIASVVRAEPEAIAGAVRSFLADPDPWKRRADIARTRVQTIYDPVRNMERVFALWDSLLAL